MPTANMYGAGTGVITDTGAKGFLKWAQQYLPDYYAYLSPKLIAQAKSQAAKSATLRGIYMGSFQKRAGMGRMGDYDNYISASYTGGIDVSNSIAPISAGAVDDSAPSSLTSDLTVSPSSSTSSAANVANSGSASNGFVTAVSAITGAVVAGTKAASQVSNNNALLQTNLQRAAQGLPPLTATTTASGSVLLGGSSGLLLVGLAVVAVLMTEKKS